MKNIISKVMLACMLMSVTMVTFCKVSYVRVYNNTQENLFVALVLTEDGSKGKKIVTNAEVKGDKIKIFASENMVPHVLKPLSYVIIPNFDSGLGWKGYKYHRNIWISNNETEFKAALRDDKSIVNRPKVYTLEVGGTSAKSHVLVNAAAAKSGYVFKLSGSEPKEAKGFNKHTADHVQSVNTYKTFGY